MKKAVFPSSFHGRRILARFAIAVSSAACVTVSHGGTVTLTAGDTLGTTSFDSGLHWSDSTAPSSGNDYVVGFDGLRTPAGTGDFTFAGDSLTINTGGTFLTKTTTPASTFTINNFTIDGGGITNANNSTIASTIIGNAFTVGGAGGTALVNNGNLNLSATTTAINGTLNVNGNAAYTVTFTGAGAFSAAGKLNLATARAAFAATSSFTFDIGASGTTYISGTNILTLNGAFNFNLGAEDFVPGNSWTIVNASTVNETYGGTFSIGNFTNSAGLWTSNDGKYVFNQSSGVLSAVPEPSVHMLLASAFIALFVFRFRRLSLGCMR